MNILKSSSQLLNKRYILMLSLLWIIPFCMSAQLKLVTGRIIDKLTKKPIEDVVNVYAFNTIATAEDAVRELNRAKAGDIIHFSPDESANPDENGFYEIHVSPNGALVFHIEGNKPVLHKVNGILEVNMALDGSIALKEVIAIGRSGTEIMGDDEAEQYGDRMILGRSFSIPSQIGKENARFILQPFCIECQEEEMGCNGLTTGKKKKPLSHPSDTIINMRPMVIDGPEYRLTQLRRKGFDPYNDLLYNYADTSYTLKPERQTVFWRDSVRIPNIKNNYKVMARLRYEDYWTIYRESDIELSPCIKRRPMQFLQYTLTEKTLDPMAFIEKPKREKRDAADKISLTFLVGKAELDPENPVNSSEIERLRSTLLEIVNGEGSTLKEFHIIGVASPEGRYASNVALGAKRVEFARRQITSILPKQTLARVYSTSSAIVAGWDELADTIRQHGFSREADEIKRIVEGHPKNLDQQSGIIQALPYYKTTIKQYLPLLRTVRYHYVHEIYRELSPQEILAKYNQNPDFKFALYEYWNLFNIIKDPAKLERLYYKAYQETKASFNKPWVLAANNLAVSYLRRDTTDLTILEPFIDRTVHRPNIVRKNFAGHEETINMDVIVANQVEMYLKRGAFNEASALIKIIDQLPEYTDLSNFVYCLGGYYKGGATKAESERRKAIFNYVSGTSPHNAVVLALALNTRKGNALAAKLIEQLDAQGAMTYYFKAIIQLRNGEELSAPKTLAQAFLINPALIETAKKDADIGCELFQDAWDEYDTMSLTF